MSPPATATANEGPRSNARAVIAAALNATRSDRQHVKPSSPAFQRGTAVQSAYSSAKNTTGISGSVREAMDNDKMVDKLVEQSQHVETEEKCLPEIRAVIDSSSRETRRYDDDEVSPYALKDISKQISAIEDAAHTSHAADNAGHGEATAIAAEKAAAAAEAAEEEDDCPPPAPGASKRYRVALIAWESLHSIAVGGVAPHLTELAAGLERRGHEVHVYVRTGANQEPYQLVDGVHIHRISFELSPDFVQEVTNMCNAMVHFMLETEAFMNAQFDCIHAHDWLAAPALINIKHNHNRQCVFTVHSTEYGRCGNNVYGGQSARIRAIEAEAIACADRVIAVSGVLCDEVKGHYSFDWDKLRCVYNGINCLRYDGALWDPAEIRSKYGVGPLDPMVLFVGRLVVQKGVDILIEAIPSILAFRPDAKFVVVGDGYMKNDLVSRVHALGIAGSICFTGSMSGQDLVDLFKATDVVAIPSRNEPFGIVVLEAWASAKPVVVTTSGGPREFVWHDNDGYLVDTNADGMAWGINKAFSNFEHLRYMGERGRVKAAYQFSWDCIAEYTNNVYDEILHDHPGLPDETSAVVSDVKQVQTLKVG